MNNPEQFSAKLKEVFDFAVANEKEMDEEANAYFDKVLSGIGDLIEQGLGKVADSGHKRKMLRLLALTQRKHHRADKLAEGLGRPLPQPFEVAEAAKPIFFAALQSILDVLFDATRQSQKGAAQVAILSMLYWTVDELNVAFYLAERKYATQTYSHLRTVHELLDKTELFFKQPRWAEVWASNDKKRIREEFSPGAVRKKLGRPSFDAVYGFLSEAGPHGTFEAVRRRMVKRGKREDRTEVAIWVGGVPWNSEVVVSVSSCVISVISTLTMAVGVYEDRLHPDEAMELLNARSNEAIDFLQKYFVKWAQESGIDASGLIETLKKPPV